MKLREYPPLLPEGLHEMSIDELRQLCVDGFNSGRDHREAVFQGLLTYLEDIETLGVSLDRIWIDGSFLTEKPVPADIDLVLICDVSEISNLDEDDVERAQQLFHGGYALDRREQYSVDAYLVYADRRSTLEKYKSRFGTARDQVTPKGIVQIHLSES
jgi:hypothetical protein